MGRDRYVPTGIDGSLPEQRVVEAAVHLPDTGAITGWGALRMAGAAYFDGRTRWRRSTVVAEALPLCSERSRSPAETRLRMVYELDARLPTPQVNRTVYDLSGRLLCVADLFDEEAGMVVEYDGAEHRKVRRHARDVRREDLCRRVGLEYAKVTGPDMHDVELVVDRLLTTRARALFRPAPQRLWTLQGPPGQRPEESVEEIEARRAWVLEQQAAERLWTPPDW